MVRTETRKEQCPGSAKSETRFWWLDKKPERNFLCYRNLYTVEINVFFVSSQWWRSSTEVEHSMFCWIPSQPDICSKAFLWCQLVGFWSIGKNTFLNKTYFKLVHLLQSNLLLKLLSDHLSPMAKSNHTAPHFLKLKTLFYSDLSSQFNLARFGVNPFDPKSD